MNWFTGLMVYIVVWWLVIFTVLPWGVRRNENPEPGHEAGAPENPMLGRKALVTTVISAVIWLIIYFVIEADIISFRDLAPDIYS
ncbi:DUF1467 family protein [Fodinicurvata fenggangensis]|uniref:DUF1467 family protein n=1 Tax=Fodinicurvata fenggangensis TaxID=1121830 RepID=UPI00047E53CD|nr:DUF1467 family protein [Fodinicurvata fenggangensis]